MMFLDKETFSLVVRSTPLVSIDLVIENAQGQTLLGLRNNRPAQGFWFVPGGRVLKGESLKDAFLRLCQDEVGLEVNIEDAVPLGSYEHFYDDSVFGESITTHYVVLAYKIKTEQMLTSLPKLQHSDYAWFTNREILEGESVHKHTKWYFTSIPEKI